MITDILLNFFFTVAGIAGLYYGAEFLVRGGVSIAKKAGISSLVIGLTLVACATSMPEMVVSVSAALTGSADISLGNIVGSNICNIALILGLCACITPLTVKQQLLIFDAPVMMAASILLAVFYLIDGGLERWHGIIFLFAWIAYTVIVIRMAKKNPQPDNGTENAKIYPLFISLLLVAGGMGFLIVGAKAFLAGAVYFAKLMNLPDVVIGLTVVAIGTSLPELATSVVAAARGERDIAIGNVLGSNIFNILGILGVTPLIQPLRNASLSMLDMGMLLLTAAALLPLMRTGWRLSRWEGLFFLILYCVYSVLLFF